MEKRLVLPQYLTSDQTKSFLREANRFHQTKRAFMNNNILLCIHLQLYAGLRIQEALNLTPSDVVLEKDTKELKVVQGKGGKDRIVPIAKPLGVGLGFINTYLHPPPHLPYIKVKYRKSVWEWYKKLGEKANVPIKGTHTLRHTFARNCLRNGVKLNNLKEILGHSSLQSTEAYTKITPNPDELNLAMEQVELEVTE